MKEWTYFAQTLYKTGKFTGLKKKEMVLAQTSVLCEFFLDSHKKIYVCKKKKLYIIYILRTYKNIKNILHT